MKLNLSSFVAQQQQAAAGTLVEFVTEASKQGFNLVKPKGTKSTVFESKAGNPQLLFLDKDGKRIYVRISTNLDAALKAGEKGIELAKSPVYHVELKNDAGTKIGDMLVVGMAAEAQEFEPVDISKGIASYAEPVA